MTGAKIAVAVAALAAAPAAAESWRLSSGDGEARAYIDTDSLRREGDRVTFWREVRWPEVRSLDSGLRFDRIAALYEGDCRAMTLRSLRISARLQAAEVYAAEDEGETEPALPGSNAEGDLRSACFGDWPDAD